MDSKCTIEVGVYCYGPLRKRSCSFPHLLHLSSSQHPANMYPVPPRMILTCYWQYRQHVWPQSQEVRSQGKRWRRTQMPCYSSSTSPCAAPPRMPTSHGLPLTDPSPDGPGFTFLLNSLCWCSQPAWQQFSSVFIWVLSLTAKTLITGTVPYPSAALPPAQYMHMIETRWVSVGWVTTRSLTNDGDVFQVISSCSTVNVIKLPVACATHNNILDSINIRVASWFIF